MVVRQPSVAVECVQCGAALPANAKFCLECGTPVQVAAERESRRTVTLLFTDVTGSTAMGEQLDPEAYRAVMGRYFAVARTAVERHGGRVEKFVGDAVLAVFGLPEVREDDALRAVRAAHELKETVAELSERLRAELGVQLMIRTGVNTGAVVTGSARAGGSFATGDAVNTAARLEQAASPGEILLGASTYGLVRDAVQTEPVAPVEAKGKRQLVVAHRLVSVLDEARGRRRHDDAPLVGRERESRALHDALERTLATGRSHLITIIGPAGIGKSRLLAEFIARIGDRAAVASGRCVSYGQGITYWPLVQALRDVLSLSGTESDEIVRHAVEHALGDTPDAVDVADLLMPLLGRSGVPGSSDSTFWAVRRLLEELAAHRPLVLTIDDLHWAEPTLLELLERVRDEVDDLPLLLVCQARPELIEQYPGWGSGALNAMTMALDPLSAGNIATALMALLDDDLPPELTATVTDWSGGNPLFVEEIVGHLLESGALRRGDAGWTLTGPDRLAMPPTVSALLDARLDRLPRAERELVERLSVIGLEFTTSEAALLSDSEELSPLLTSLARRDLLRRVRSNTGETWAFKHLMIRDAAYESLAKALRAELHERFADALEQTEDAGLERASFVAHHLAQAGHYHRELGARSPAVEALVERAVEALVTAAREARDREELEAAVALLSRALELEPGSVAVRRVVLGQLAVVHMDMSDLDGLRRALDRLETELADDPSELDAALSRTLNLEWAMGTSEEVDPNQLRQAADELIALARAADEPWLIVVGLRCHASASMMKAQWAEAAANTEEVERIGAAADLRQAAMLRGSLLFFGAAPLRAARDVLSEQAARSAGSERQELRGLSMDALVLAAEGSEEAAAALAAALAKVEEIEAGGRRAATPFLLDVFVLRRDLDGAITWAQRMNDEFRQVGDTGHASTYILFQAVLMHERGDSSSAIRSLVDEAAGYTSPHDTLSVAYLAAARSLLCLRSGDLAEATSEASRAIATVDRSDQVWQQADVRRVLAEVWRAVGDAATERRALSEALERYALKEIGTYDAVLTARLAELG